MSDCHENAYEFIYYGLLNIPPLAAESFIVRGFAAMPHKNKNPA